MHYHRRNHGHGGGYSYKPAPGGRPAAGSGVVETRVQQTYEMHQLAAYPALSPNSKGYRRGLGEAFYDGRGGIKLGGLFYDSLANVQDRGYFGEGPRTVAPHTHEPKTYK